MRENQNFERSLAGISLFGRLGGADRTDIERQCTWWERASGDYIIHESEDTKSIYFLVSGSAMATSFLANGRMVGYRVIDAGEIFGEYSAIDGEPRSANVVALTPCLVASMRPAALREIFGRHAAVAWAFMEHLTGQLRQLTERVARDRAYKIGERILIVLLALARAHPIGDNCARLPRVFTSAYIASLADSVREEVDRQVAILRRKSIVASGRPIHIQDVAGLEAEVTKFIDG